MLNVDQSNCEFLPISPGSSSSRVTRQTKEDPGDEVVMNADYYEDHSKSHKYKALITIPMCFRFFKALAG